MSVSHQEETCNYFGDIQINLLSPSVIGTDSSTYKQIDEP